jgi:hypothetical protein
MTSLALVLTVEFVGEIRVRQAPGLKPNGFGWGFFSDAEASLLLPPGITR